MCVHKFTKIGVSLEHVHVVSTDTSEGAKATVKQEKSDTPQPVSDHPGIMMYQISVCNNANLFFT